jgi:hypothetical protein
MVVEAFSASGTCPESMVVVAVLLPIVEMTYTEYKYDTGFKIVDSE